MTTYCVQNNKGMMPIQENSDFSVNFSADYLVVPNILLTHTHTHRCIAANLFPKRFYARVREAPCISINKGSPRVLFASFFVPLQKIYKKENKIKIKPVKLVIR